MGKMKNYYDECGERNTFCSVMLPNGELVGAYALENDTLEVKHYDENGEFVDVIGRTRHFEMAVNMVADHVSRRMHELKQYDKALVESQRPSWVRYKEKYAYDAKGQVLMEYLVLVVFAITATIAVVRLFMR